MIWTMHSLTGCSPSVGPYCSAAAVAPSAMRSIAAMNRRGSKSEVSGSPPASEMMSGRSVTAIRSRITEERIRPVRVANSAL